MSESGADTRIRTAQWGHWGITFSEHDVDAYGRQSYAPAVIRKTLSFPVGACGPVDLPRRDEYRQAVRNWIDNGVLP